MNVRKSDVFLADVERQYEWYALNADLEIAERYLEAILIMHRALHGHRDLPRRLLENSLFQIRRCLSISG
jgi:hypothetical protein